MRKRIRKTAAFLLAVVLAVPGMGMVAKAADYNHKLSVDTKRNANPGESHFSMEYFDTSDYSFKKMDKFVEAGGSSYWTIEGDTSVAIKGWTQSASSSKYAVVRYTAADSGDVTVQKETDVRTGAFTGSAGDFLVVQKSAEGYSPIWPEKGSWKWESVAKDGATDFANTGLKTYVKAGDELLFITRSSSKTITNVNINYWVSMTKSENDTGSLRPLSWDSYFKGADDKLATAGPWLSSPYVSKDTNVDTKVYTQEYISSTEGFQKLDTYNTGSPAYWSLASDANLRIGPYYMMATANKYSAMVYHAAADGYVDLTNKYQLFTSKNAAYDEAEAMVVLSNNQEYYPVWPVKGSWEWKTVPKGTATDGVELDLTTYMKAGDELALVVRSSNTEKGMTWMQTDCSTHFTAIANDYRRLYPDTDEWSPSFEGYSFRMPLGPWTEQKESWHIAKESSDVFTAEYNAGNGFAQMENYISDAKPAYWQSKDKKVLVKPYMQTGTADTYSAAVFHMPVTGYLKIENAYKPIYTHYMNNGAYEPAEAILVQKSTDADGKEMWSPIWPSRGEWKYQVLPMRSSAEDTAGIELSANTYAKAGDEIYFVVRSGLESTGLTGVQSELDMFYMEADTDTGNLYPTTWSDAYPYTKAEIVFETDLADVTIGKEDGQIRQILQYRPVFADTDRANPIFKNIPKELVGKSFINTQCWGGGIGWTKTATAKTDGWVYALVTNSRASKVVADGFKYVPLEITDLFFGANNSDSCKLYKKYVHAGDSITIYDRWMLLIFETLENEADYTQSDSFIPPVIVYPDDKEAANYAKADRQWQGCSSIVQTSKDVLYAAWITGGPHETAAGNYITFRRSTDGGITWKDYMCLVSDDQLTTVNKVGEAAFHFAEDGSLWVFMDSTRNGNSYHGTWTMHTENPNDPNPVWSKPKWICPGVINTKLTVLSNGMWIMATMALYDDVDYTDIWASDDKGETWYLRGQAYVPETYVDECCIVELEDGRLWLTVRSIADYGIAESFSSDGGRTWTEGRDSKLGGPGSKFMMQRLKSGNLLLINHYDFMGRDHITALLSTDDGKTWSHKLLLDERTTSYPYVTTWDYNGEEVITVIYDHERYDAKQIYTARFTEQDIMNGTFSSKYAYQKRLIDSLSGDALFDFNNSWFVQQNTNPYPWGYCTYGYFDGKEFKTMETYVPAEGNEPAHWQSKSGESRITNWRVFGTKNETPLISFYVGKSGYLEISEDALNPLQTNGVDGKFMIVQVNGDGQYCPLYPKAGKWKWQDISTKPTDIGTIRTYMNSDDKVYVIWKSGDGNDIAVETMAHFKFTYSSTDTEEIYKAYTWTRWLGGGDLEKNQTKADEVSERMSSLKEITLKDAKEVKEIRKAYEKLTDIQKALVKGMEYLTAAEQKLANLEKKADCGAYLERLLKVLPKELNEESLTSYKEAAAAYQMLTKEEKKTLANKEAYDNLVQKLNEYLSSMEKVRRVERLINEIPLPYELAGRKYLEKAYGAYKELTVEEQEMVENEAALQALRRMTALKDSTQNLPNYEVALIDALPKPDDMKLTDVYEVLYAKAFYAALTKEQQGSVKNYEILQAAIDKITQLQAAAKGNYYTVTAQDTQNGTIITSGKNQYGKDRKVIYQIIPFVGCDLVDVLVDGVSVGAVSTYFFDGFDADHTISAVFTKRIVSYEITLKAGKGGSIVKVNGSNEEGSDITYQIKADKGYEIEEVVVDGKSVGKTTRYTFTELCEDHTLEARFKKTVDSGRSDAKQPEIPADGQTGTQTGDLASLAVWALLMLIASGVIAVFCYRNKKKDKKEA